jgi:hypothetical protein
MKASPLSELFIKECEFFFKNKAGEKYFVEPSWIDMFVIHWDLLKMNGLVGSTLSFQDYLSFHETMPIEPGVTFEVNLVDTQKNKFKYIFIVTDFNVETVKRDRKRITAAMMDPYSYKMSQIFDSKGYSLKRTDEIWNAIKTDPDYKLDKPVNGHHEFINSTKDWEIPTDFCKTYSYILNGKKSLFRNLKDKYYEEGLLCFTDRKNRQLTFLKEIFKDKEPRSDIYHVVAPNDNYYYKIDEVHKLPPEIIDLQDDTLKKEWFSQFYAFPQRVDIDLPEYEKNFGYKKKINKPYDYHAKIGENDTRLNDVSPEGRIIHTYLSKVVQRHKIKIMIYGDFTLEIGTLLETCVYSTGGRTDEVDEEMSGVWLVIGIQDVIQPPSFYQIVTLARPRIMKTDTAPVKPK